MSEYSGEAPRIPIERPGAGDEVSRRRAGPVGEFLALEFPRESVAWVLGDADRPRRARTARSNPPRTRVWALFGRGRTD